MYKLLLGIEHLMTGAQLVLAEKVDDTTVAIFRFSSESAPVVAVTSDYKFEGVL